MDYEVSRWLLKWRLRMRHMFERQGGDILNILLILTRIHLSRTIWNNSYLFIIIVILLVLDSKTSVYVYLHLFIELYNNKSPHTMMSHTF